MLAPLGGMLTPLGVTQYVAASNWWESGGATGCVAAYQPKGAASLAASYSNLANPGTHDATAGDAPTFNTATGWTFDGFNDYLITDLVPATDKSWSVLVQFSGLAASDGQTLIGDYDDRHPPAVGFLVQSNNGAGNNMGVYNGSDTSFGNNATSLSAGNYGFAGLTPYRNGVAESTLIPSTTMTSPGVLYIGALHYRDTTVIQRTNGKIIAIAVYDNTLTAPQMAAVAAAMAAL